MTINKYSSRVGGWDLAEWLERMAVNAEFATALGASPASSDTVESEGSADEAVLNNLPKSQKSPWKISILAVTRKRMFF